MRGMPPFSPAELARAASGEKRLPKARSSDAAPRSSWVVLGVDPHANALEIKRAFRKRALETHPDQGGDAAEFRAVKAAYEKVMSRERKNRRAKRKRTP
jgi:DnaJ-domain-containing protein 1